MAFLDGINNPCNNQFAYDNIKLKVLYLYFQKLLNRKVTLMQHS